jgi:hypothetical protein
MKRQQSRWVKRIDSGPVLACTEASEYGTRVRESDSNMADEAASESRANESKPDASSWRDRVTEWFSRRDALREAANRPPLDDEAAARLEHASRALDTARGLGLDEDALRPALGFLREAATWALAAMTPG